MRSNSCRAPNEVEREQESSGLYLVSFVRDVTVSNPKIIPSPPGPILRLFAINCETVNPIGFPIRPSGATIVASGTNASG